MVLIEELLFDLEDRLNENNIKSKDIDKFFYVYGLDVKELKKLFAINWNDGIILENLIKTFSSDNKYKDDKIDLLTLVSDATDIENDREKILACTSIINGIEDFKGDIKSLTEIVNKVMNSKTKEGAILSKKIVRNILGFINEEGYSEKDLFALRVRLSEIVGFVTREEETYKIEATDKIIESYPKNNLGVLCGIVYSIMSSENNNQTSAIIDVANNKKAREEGLTLKMCLTASKLNKESLLELYQILDFSSEMSNQELNDEIEYIINKDRNIKSKQRKISANK